MIVEILLMAVSIAFVVLALLIGICACVMAGRADAMMEAARLDVSKRREDEFRRGWEGSE